MESLTQAQLLNYTLELMEDELRISKKQARDFIESSMAAAEDAVADGKRVSFFGVTIFTPSFVLAKPKRKGNDPRTGEERTYDAQPAKLRLKAAVPKRFKDALPSTSTKAAKALKAEAEERKAAAEKRAKDREREEAKAAKAAAAPVKKSGGAKKSSAKKSGGKKSGKKS